MRKNKIKLLLFTILIWACIISMHLHIFISSSDRQHGPHLPASAQDEQQIDESCIERDFSFGPVFTSFHVHTRFQLFERNNQSGYHYRINHQFNYSLDTKYMVDEFNLTGALQYVWYFQNQIFIYYRIDNLTISENYTTQFNVNYTFSTLSPIDMLKYDVNWDKINGNIGDGYRRPSTSLFPTVHVPNLNQFTYYITVLTDSLSFQIQKNVIWANTSLAIIQGIWISTVLKYDANFDVDITKFTVSSFQHLNGNGHEFEQGISIELNKTSKITQSRDLFIWDMNHTKYLLEGTYNLWSSDDIEFGTNHNWTIFSPKKLTYTDDFVIAFRMGLTYSLMHSFTCEVQQEPAPIESAEINYTAIYVIYGVFGAIYITLIGILINSFIKEKRKKLNLPPTIRPIDEVK